MSKGIPTLKIGSRLLGALPPDVVERLWLDLEVVNLELKDVLYGEEKPIRHVYFPVGCVVSLVTLMENGEAVEIGTIGKEGFVGLPLLFDSGQAPRSARAFCQVPGEALRLGVEPFEEALRRDMPLRTLLLRYAGAVFSQISQSAACNRLHSIDERCCRWLLMTRDQIESDHFLLTQEFLSQMLGVRRASVNAVAGLLQQSGLIRYSRGRITILDPKALEEAACECYRAMKLEYERMIGGAAPGKRATS
jgi:CRP-like cAMP-binding protein